eukprot:3656005-Pyramimonas_sp.AAC.1
MHGCTSKRAARLPPRLQRSQGVYCFVIDDSPCYTFEHFWTGRKIGRKIRNSAIYILALSWPRLGREYAPSFRGIFVRYRSTMGRHRPGHASEEPLLPVRTVREQVNSGSQLLWENSPDRSNSSAVNTLFD